MYTEDYMMRKIKPESAKEAYGDMSPMDAKSADAKVILPSTGFDNKTLPEAADWKVGKTYRVVLDLTMRGISQRKGRDGVERGNYDFDIVAIDPQGEAPAAKKPAKRYSGDLSPA